MLKANNITKFYGEGGYRTPALRGVSLKIPDGAFIAVMSPSGSGKSTLLNMLGSLDRPTEGEVILDGIRIDNLGEDELVAIRRERIAYVFQQYHLLPSLTALENVILPLTFSGKIDGAEERGLELLKRFGLEGRARHRPDQLSGGEKQRVAIARAIIGGASVILADEPTGNVDQKTGTHILELFKELNREGRTIVMVPHIIEGKNIVMEMNDLTRSYEKTLERG